MISTYPPAVRKPLLEDLFEHLTRTLPHDPKAIKLRALHPPGDDDQWTEAPELVDRLRRANEQLVKGVKDENVDKEEMGQVYAECVESWLDRLHDENLVSRLHPCGGNGS